MRVRTAIYVADPSDDSDEAVARLLRQARQATRPRRPAFPGVVKGFADGVMEYPAQTAALLSPNLDSNGKLTKHSGELISIRSVSPGWCRSSTRPVLPSTSTPSATRAVRASLDAFASARAANGDKDNRHQIAHLQLVIRPISRASRSSACSRLSARMGQARARYRRANRSLISGLSATAISTPRRQRASGRREPSLAAATGTSPPTIRSVRSNRCHALRRQGTASAHIDERIPLETAIDAYTSMRPTP